MPKQKPTRIYIRSDEKRFRRLAWFAHNKSNELLIGAYGLSGGPATLIGMWPKRELASLELESVNYKWSELDEVGTIFDHITCHADGRFHVKTKGGPLAYTDTMKWGEPFGPDSSLFLEFTLVGDLTEKYALIRGSTKLPNFSIETQPSEYAEVRGMLSGVNFPLEAQMVAVASKFKGFNEVGVIRSETLKLAFTAGAKQLPPAAKDNRPRGTLLSFKFRLPEDRWQIKSFILA